MKMIDLNQDSLFNPKISMDMILIKLYFLKEPSQLLVRAITYLWEPQTLMARSQFIASHKAKWIKQ